MTVVDTSVVVDYLLADGVARAAQELFADDLVPTAPDVLVFEVLAVLRRDVGRSVVTPARGERAIERLRELRVELFPSLGLAGPAWARRHNLSAADALFVALADALDESLATKDAGLARAADRLGVAALLLA